MSKQGRRQAALLGAASFGALGLVAVPSGARPLVTTTTAAPATKPARHAAVGIDRARSGLAARHLVVSAETGTILTVSVRDRSGRGVARQKITLRASDVRAAPVRGVTSTGASGTATFLVRDPTARAVTTVRYLARDATARLVIGTLSVTFVPPSAPDPANTTITVSAAGGQRSPALATVTVMVNDYAGRPEADLAVTLLASGGASVRPRQATTDAQGLATFTVSSRRHATETVTALAPGSPPVVLGSMAVRLDP